MEHPATLLCYRSSRGNLCKKFNDTDDRVVKVSLPPQQSADRSTVALLAEIHAELSNIEGDITEVGEMVRGLERVCLCYIG